ncbi:response regulator transcription factor [Arthrobacter sp. B0490]|uniref:response regulator transcription factor n=1 Tax=Arthrobacter sp. B0490 TaxID=2058891 RepID=UPI000CE468C2|nr:response regulator transcription factor [Arthrobacter sp. B0490]
MRVVIGEDEALLRQGLTLVLEQEGFDVVAAVPDAGQLLDAVARHRPDLVVTDIRMPPTHTDEGLVAALRIRSEHPDSAVVVLSQYVQRRYALELLTNRPGVGYLLKQRIADVEAFCADLRRVAAGGTALDPEVVDVLVKRARLARDDLARLTRRQREVLSLMAEGRSNAGIASRLVVTEKAVVQHSSRIYEALGLPVAVDDHRRVLAVIRYLAR